MRILLTGAAGWKNVGDDLIAMAICDWASDENSFITVAGGDFIAGVPVNAQAKTVMGAALGSRVKLLFEISKADVVLIGGGGLLDDRIEGFYRPFYRIAQACRLLRTRYAFVGIGVGPVRRPNSASDYAAMANGASEVMVRDAESAERLRELGVLQKIEVVPDPVLWMPRQPWESSDTAETYDVCLNIRNWGIELQDHLKYPVGADELAQVVARAINEKFGEKAKIALLSMSGLDGDDDSTALGRVQKLLIGTTHIFYSATADEARDTVRRSSIVVSMRLHGCLLGVVEGRRVVGISYDPKVEQQGARIGFPVVRLDHRFDSDSLKVAIGLGINSSNGYAAETVPRRPWE